MNGAIPVLRVSDLSVAYRVRGRDLEVLRGVSFTIARGEAYGLVGESGCGKSTAALAALGSLPRAGRVSAGRIELAGIDLRALSEKKLRRLRAHAVSMVYQDPGRALNPTLSVGRQMAEAFEVLGMTTGEAMARSQELLERVQLAQPARAMAAWPHQLSGGMQQRVVIAMALAKNPELLILDEPTTGLDATIEAEILELIAGLRRDLSTSILYISHNLALIGRMCDRVGVLYAGRLVEEGSVRDILHAPRHPYTTSLLRCLPEPGRRKDQGRLEPIPGFLPAPGSAFPGCVFAPRCPLADAHCRAAVPPAFALGHDHFSRCFHHDQAVPGTTLAAGMAAHRPPDDARETLLEVVSVSKTYTATGQKLQALSDVSLSLAPGETLGLVGESGSGKTTLARVLLGLTEADAGSRLLLHGKRLPGRARARNREQVKALQIIFQNPESALNRAHTVRYLVGRALKLLAGLSGRAQARELARLLATVRLSERHLGARPRQLSGGQKQRVAIARAFAGGPRVVICDEPTSALDVSVQAAVLNLLAELQAAENVSYVFISHDLGVVRYLADRIAVLYCGRLMEIGPAKSVFDGPHHPYTEALLSAQPSLAEAAATRIRLGAEMPGAFAPPSGCVFHTRCHRRLGPICETEEPLLTEQDGHAIRCHIPRGELGGREKTAACLSP